MEIDKRRNVQDNAYQDQTSDVRSFGSNYMRCSQSRKMSISVAAESSANVSNFAGKRGCNSKGKKGSLWISPKPQAKSGAGSESFTKAREVGNNVPHVGGLGSNFGGVTEPSATAMESVKAKQKNVDSMVSGKGSMKDTDTDRGKGPLPEAMEDISVPEEWVKQDELMKEDKPTENRNKEFLKMKLWEVLGNGPSIDEEMNDARNDDVNANATTQKDSHKEDPSFKPRVNSDSIETDSETPEVAVSRPVTRALARKRGPTRAYPRRLRKKLFPATEENNVFSFEDKGFIAQNAASGRGLPSKVMSNGKKNLKTRTTKTSVPLRKRGNIQQTSSGSKKTLSKEEISLRRGMGITRGNQEQERRKQAIRSESSQPSSEAEDSGQLGRKDSPVSPESEGRKDPIDCESAPKDADRSNHLFSPANKRETATHIPQPHVQENGIENENYTDMLAKRILSVRETFRSKSGLTSRQMNLGSNVRKELSDGPAESDDTTQSIREKADAELFAPGKVENDKTEEELSNSSAEDMDDTPERVKFSDLSPAFYSPNVLGGDKDATTPEGEAANAEEQTPCQNHLVNRYPQNNYNGATPDFSLPSSSGEEMDTSPEAGHLDEEILHPKGHYTYEGGHQNVSSPALFSPNATRLTELSQEYQEDDDLDGEIALFGCALEKFKSRLLSSIMQKSSNIVESAAEEIHSKFNSAKSQIEKDLTKLTTSSRSRSKLLEESFKEQQEQLRLVHEKFRDEIQRHLEDFTRTVESFEAHETELKGVVERRKASYHKLLLQVEEAAENHLSDAQRRLVSVRNAGRSKMQHLKAAIAGCLEDGIFT